MNESQYYGQNSGNNNTLLRFFLILNLHSSESPLIARYGKDVQHLAILYTFL